MSHRVHYPDRGYNRTLLHWKVRNTPLLGLYYWRRGFKRGLVLRVGALGHIQLQVFHHVLIGKKEEGRRRAHGLGMHWWGVRGRRRKRGIEVRVYL